MKKYRVHKLKKNDTVIIVAVELGITVQELVGFHNVHCKNDDVISLEFPNHLTELLVYPYIREIKKESYPTAKFVSGYTLSCIPNPKKVSYGVMFTIFSGVNSVNTIKYKTSVLFKNKVENGFCYQIDRLSETYINDEQATLLADELAEKVAKVLYPLDIIVDQKGKFVAIANFNEIQKRWVITKEKILYDYEGQWVTDYLTLTEQTLENESNLQNALESDWFLNAFFGGIYINYTQKFKLEDTITFPILANVKSLAYKVECSIDEYLDENGQVIIDQNGVLEDARAKADFENGLPVAHYALIDEKAEKAAGTFRAKYFLKATDNSIESIYLACSIALDEPKKIEIVVSLLH